MIFGVYYNEEGKVATYDTVTEAQIVATQKEGFTHVSNQN